MKKNSVSVSMPPQNEGRSLRRQSVTKPIVYADHYAELLESEKNSFGFRQLLNPAMLNGWVKHTDPITGLQGQARIAECRWIERGRIADATGKLLESIRRVRINPSDLVDCFTARLKESHVSRAKLHESDWFDYGLDSGAGAPGVYLPMPPGPYTKQLYLQDRWSMKAKCFQARNHNPILKGAIAVMTAFVIGDGVAISAADPDAQTVWDEFEDRVQLQRRLPTFCDMLSIDGDLFLHTPVFQPGYLDLVSIDSGTVWEIITEPTDIRKVYGYWRQFSTAYQIFTVDNVPSVEYIIDIVPPEEVIHLKINVQESEKFGRSDLFSSLSTAAMLQEIMRYRGIRIMNEAALVIDHTITGDSSDIARIAQERSLPLGPGTETFHPTDEKIEFHAWPGSGTQKSGFHEESLAHIGTGFGTPKEYIGGGDQASRAAALTSTEPAAKMFKRRQTEFEFPLYELFRKVMQEAKRGGRLPQTTSEDCECTFSELIVEDKTQKLNRIILEEQAGYFSHKRCCQMVARLEDVTTYDADEETQDIQSEKAQNVANDPRLAAMYNQPTNMNVKPAPTPSSGPGGMGGSGGGSTQSAQLALPSSSENMNGDRMGISSKSRAELKQTLGTKESVSGTGKQPFTIQAARFEVAKMRRSGFKMTEGDESVPKDWENTVKKLKGHPEIDNPYALANWMDYQGYAPGGKGGR